MSDEEWNAFWDGYILAQGVNQAMQYKQQNQNQQKKRVSRKEAQKVQEDVKKLQKKVQRMLDTSEEDYKVMRKQADERWSAEHNAVTLAQTDEIYQYVMDHRNEVLDFLVGFEDRASEAYQEAVRPYVAMSSSERMEQYCLKKYGKHFCRNRRADTSYKNYVSAYIDKCLEE